MSKKPLQEETWFPQERLATYTDFQLNFADKIKVVKDYLKISTVDMSVIAGISYRNYSNYERSQTEPKVSVIRNISLFTGFSASWLLNLSPEPFDEAFINELEQHIITSDFNSNSVLSVITIPEHYKDDKLRKKIYSLEARCNMIYLLNTTLSNELKLKADLKSWKDTVTPDNYQEELGKIVSNHIAADFEAIFYLDYLFNGIHPTQEQIKPVYDLATYDKIRNLRNRKFNTDPDGVAMKIYNYIIDVLYPSI